MVSHVVDHDGDDMILMMNMSLMVSTMIMIMIISCFSLMVETQSYGQEFARSDSAVSL